MYGYRYIIDCRIRILKQKFSVLLIHLVLIRLIFVILHLNLLKTAQNYSDTARGERAAFLTCSTELFGD